MTKKQKKMKWEEIREMMKVAFILLVHKGIRQVNRLVNKLDCKGVDIFIHVDANSGDHFYNELKSSLDNFQNVYFTERTKCYWGDFSLVEATLKGLRYARSNNNYDYYLLLSGQDYPIKSIDYIIEFLKNNKGKSFLDFTQFNYINWYEGGFARTKNWNFRIFQRKKENPSFINRGISRSWRVARSLLPKRKYLLNNYTQYGGSQWWCLTGELVEYINSFLAENKKYERFFRFVEIPDEIFFQTLILNSPYQNKLVNDNLRYMSWRDTTASPSNLNKTDFIAIMESNSLFARKFDVEVDEKILDMIDEHLNKRKNKLRVINYE